MMAIQWEMVENLSGGSDESPSLTTTGGSGEEGRGKIFRAKEKGREEEREEETHPSRMRTPPSRRRTAIWVKEAEKETKRAKEEEEERKAKEKEEEEKAKEKEEEKTKKKEEGKRRSIEELSTATTAMLKQQLLLSSNSMGSSVLEGIKILERRRPVEKFTGVQFKKAINLPGMPASLW